ncbi:hypothetical protein O3P69_001791 [Scylla paramamosain]|uniref:Secreted protein n=1 Tax=Scylla paramamosain TaxID=85552 RepID=A0AAW0V0H1_SCYPA
MAVLEVAVLYTTATVVTAVGHLKVHVYGTSFGRLKTSDDRIIPDLPPHVSRDAAQGGVPRQVPAQCPITEQQLGGAVQTPPQPRPKPGDCCYLLHNVGVEKSGCRRTSSASSENKRRD